MTYFNPGTYRARGVTAALGLTSKGSEQVAVELTFVDGEYQGQSATWYGYFTDKTTDRTLDSLRNLGWEGDDLADLSGIDKNEVAIVIDDEQDDHGNVRSRVRWINRAGGLALKERMNPAQLQDFAARMRGKVLAHKQGGGQQRQASAGNGGQRKPPNRSSGYEAPPPNDDDIPF